MAQHVEIGQAVLHMGKGAATAREGGASRTIAQAELADHLDRPLAVEFGEFPSAASLIVEGLGGFRFGSPREWQRSVVSALDGRDFAAVEPLVRSLPTEVPSCLCILPHRTRSGRPSLEEDLERIGATPPEQLVAQLPNNGHWDAVARKPRRWLEDHIRTVRRASEGLREPSKRAAGAFDWEAERVAVASVRGAESELFATRLPPRLHALEAQPPAGMETGNRLGIVPVLSGPRMTAVWFRDGELTHIVYPLPGAWRMLEPEPRSQAGLEALLGKPRALILRKLERPMSVGAVAELLIAVPSAATHHLGILERAGLIERRREGRHMLVRRTARGSEVLELYEHG